MSRTHLRTRLTVAMAGIAVGVLVFAGVATLVYARRSTANSTEAALRSRAPGIARSLGTLCTRVARQQSRGARLADVYRQFLRGTLRLANGGLVTVTTSGAVQEGARGCLGTATQPAGRGATSVLDLPTGVQVSDLDTAALRDGRATSGRNRGRVFVAQPLPATAAGVPVLVLSDKIPTPTGRAGGFFLFAAALAVGAAAVVSFLLARRLTRPLAAMRTTAGRIAAGDLSARVDLGSHPPDELAELATGLNAMASQLEQARGLERGFLLSVSHDLRTPLTSIKGYAEAMIDGTLDDPESRRRAAEVIEAESRRLERLVADLLDLARLDAHQFSFRPRPFDAAVTVTQAVEAFRRAATELGLSMTIRAPESVAADADPERIGQIVANLVENALKYAASEIAVDVTTNGASLDVQVADDGPGVDPADLPHVFDRLYTSRGSPGRSVGTGLGLAIVRELTAAMGGSARAERPGSGGTRFVVRLPVLSSAPAAPPPVPWPPPRASGP